MITRGLIEWCDKKFADAIGEKDERKGNAKAFASGAVEGYADAAILMYLPMLIACYYYKYKADKK